MSERTLRVPVILEYTSTAPSSITADPVLVAFSRACGADRVALELEYTIVADVESVSLFGYKPTFSGRSIFNCPINSEEFGGALAGLSGFGFTPNPPAVAPPVAPLAAPPVDGGFQPDAPPVPTADPPLAGEETVAADVPVAADGAGVTNEAGVAVEEVVADEVVA
jgi:hypothetical protein